MEIQFHKHPHDESATIVVGCFEDKKLTGDAKKIDDRFGGLLTKSLKHSKFKGSKGQTMSLTLPGNGEVPRILIVGFGKSEDLNASTLNTVGGSIYAALAATPDTHAEIYLSASDLSSFTQADAGAEIAMGIQLRSWQCKEFKTNVKAEDKPSLQKVSMITAIESSGIYDSLKNVAEGVFFTRRMVTYPPNILYPETFANHLKENLEPLGVKVEILDKSEIEKLGMGALLGVNQGSIREPRVVVMQWLGDTKDAQPVAFIGKGVTFDSGGISLKPANGMEDMKYDMAGAGVVGGLMKALAARKAKVNAIGVVGLVENMPSGSAQRPSDIVTSMSGITIEVLNTDAEGRLVLADVLWYTQDRFKPKLMVNLATLTGAIVVALGDQYAGLFSNNDDLSNKLVASGTEIDEKLWRLPLSKEYDKDVDSEIADIKNIGGGRKAGSITAAQFLQRFVNNVPWAHLDIAGMAWAEKSIPVAEKGATGFGVRLLEHFVRQNYEQ